MKNMKYGILGAGVVGQATGNTIKVKLNEDVLYYDIEDKPGITIEKDFNVFAKACHTIFICLPTPLVYIASEGNKSDSSLITRYAVKATLANPDAILVQRSTCVPGTADSIAELLGIRYFVMPEFLSEKTAFEDSLNPSRIIVGTNTDNIPENLQRFISSFDTTIAYVTRKDAESAKLISNYMLALYISFWNEILDSNICDNLDIVMNMVCLDPNLNNPKRVFGKAFGGKCLPKDTQALLTYAYSINARMPILDGVICINNKIADKFGTRTESLSELKDKGLL